MYFYVSKYYVAGRYTSRNLNVEMGWWWDVRLVYVSSKSN